MLLDIAIGILLAILTSEIFHFPLSSLWLALGIGFALLPDVDVIWEGVRLKGKIGGKILSGHREWTHYPLLYPPVILLIYWYFGLPLAFLAALGLFWHVLHDTMGTGWGVPLLGPFSRRNYKFFSRKDGSFDWNTPVVSWEKEELREVVREHGNPHWIRDIYLRPTFVSVTEVIAIIVAILILIFIYS